MKKIKRQEHNEPVLEMEPSLEGKDLFSFLSVWYGPPKIGKTTLLSKFPGVYFLVTEPGYKFLKIRKTKINNWTDFKAFVKYVKNRKDFLKTVKGWCIDPVDKLAKFCMDYVCTKRDIDHPSDQEWGKGWEAFRDEFAEWILRLCAIGPGVAVISHIKERDVMFRGMTITKETPAMPKTCYTILNDLADIIVYIGYEEYKRGKEQRRCLYCRGTENIEAGDRTGHLPPVIPFKSEQHAVDVIMDCFNPKIEKGGKKIVVDLKKSMYFKQ